MKTLKVGLLVSICSIAAFGQSPKRVEDELLRHFTKLEQVSNYGGTRDSQVQDVENKAIRQLFIKYGRRADVLSYPFSRLSDKLQISTSRDGKLRAYSWNDEGGGTMKNFYTAYQFQGRSGKVHIRVDPFLVDISEHGVGSLVHDIFQTDTKSAPIYLTVSTLIGSASLSGQFISAVKIDGERLNLKSKVIRTSKGLTDTIFFEYDFFSVVDHPERPVKLCFYDEAKRSFRFPVVIEDEKTPQGRVTNKFIIYRFDGNYFVKVK